MLDKDISDNGLKNIIIPFNDNYNLFLENYIIPEVVAFYIASSFYRSVWCEGNFKQFFNSALDIFNFNDNWYVFSNIDPLPETTSRDRKTKNAFKAGVKDIRVHDFRHSCASLLIDSGANITLVAKYLGHSKIDETLNTYSHMDQNRLENIVQIIEVQNTKLLESKQKELPEPKETIIDYEDANYYDYDEDLGNKKRR